eukprot:15199954-Ditylum_brightwellii.AAC.1
MMVGGEGGNDHLACPFRSCACCQIPIRNHRSTVNYLTKGGVVNLLYPLMGLPLPPIGGLRLATWEAIRYPLCIGSGSNTSTKVSSSAGAAKIYEGDHKLPSAPRHTM